MITNRRLYLGAIVAAGVLGAGLQAFATTSAPASTLPREFAYQGYLEDSGGPITGTRRMQFFMVNDAATGAFGTDCDHATCKWYEDEAAVVISGGYFTVKLGDSSPLDAKTFTDYPNLWLKVRVFDETEGNPVELDGAQKLLATPYSITAQTAQQFYVTDDLRVQGGVEIGDHPGTTDPGVGDLYVANDLQVGGGVAAGSIAASGALNGSALTTTGNVTVGGTLSVGSTSGILFRYGPYTASGGGYREIYLSPAKSICFLTEMRIYDNEGSGGTEKCEIRINSSTSWRIYSDSHNDGGSTTADDIVCTAYCLSWR